MTALEFRDARREDVPAIMALLAADSLGATREPTNGRVPESVWNAFDVISRDPYNRQIVAEQAGRIVGCMQLTLIPGLTYSGGTRLQIEGVRVAEDLRRKGIGRRMFDWAIADARRKGVRLVQLTHHASRGPADAFYRSLGFTPSHVGMKLDLGTKS
ncbi:MAG: GNAT family N-acetyltransferase [Rhizobiales bacterium]|nr:GNAT family N-acetyltransferase [Hyphomicrobiales bacterium]